ncbi:MMPL family transporter [Actinomadura darangshiensis]|uniref:MMPL family transporter n=1 Tax=Actinomadura darangshiensis TaxID=705336 RepID=A0A4R5A9T9_9ACTN|nr:MMPL family transporter [Actinomadura darangshiensis]TDD67464.1 MMPL family transporter [Actinomadura darangshiensis]
MAVLLARLGRFCFRRRQLVVLLWTGLLVAAVSGAAVLSEPAPDTFSVPGTEAQRANDLVESRFPAAGGAAARIVFAGPSLTAPETRAAVGQAAARIKAAPEVAEVGDPYAAVSPDGRTAFAEIAYRVPAYELTDADREALHEAATVPGVRVELSGDAVAPPGEGAGELLGVAAAAIVLLVALGSVVAAGLPLLTAATGIGIGVSVITAMSAFTELNSDTPALALMLGLAVAIDYALFVISRYRQEVLDGREPADAAGRAAGTAGSAVVFAGLTVVIALAGLAVVDIPVLTQLGLAAAFTVTVAVLVALTLLPALLGFAGRRALARRRPSASWGHRWGRLVTSHPVMVLLLAIAGLLVAATPALGLRLGLPDDGTAPPETTQRQAYDLLAKGFGPGINGPLTLVVQAPRDALAAAERVAHEVKPLDGVAAVAPPVLNPAGDTALVSVVPGSGPTSEATEDLIHTIRDRFRARDGLTVAVTGQTAIDIDTSEKLAGALVPYLAVVVGLAFLLLTVVFRSILVPLKATLGFLLSVAATFGAVVAVFQWGWLNGPLGVHSSGVIVNLLPVMLIGMVFGLAMDYQVFLVTRMREEHVRGAAPTDAAVAGLAHGARVVTAAAIIMISVFAGFLLSATPMVQSFGFALAAAVLFDAFLVRLTIVPAVMALLGRAGWWLPTRLGRVLPHVDVEGDGLRDRTPVGSLSD